MYFEDGLFDIEIYCKMCNSNNVDIEYDSDNNCIKVKCADCGCEDNFVLC